MSSEQTEPTAQIDALVSQRFVAVVHRWFVDSRGFVVKQLEATTRDEAEKEAAVLYRQHNRPFCSADVVLVELEAGEAIVSVPVREDDDNFSTFLLFAMVASLGFVAGAIVHALAG